MPTPLPSAPEEKTGSATFSSGMAVPTAGAQAAVVGSAGTVSSSAPGSLLSLGLGGLGGLGEAKSQGEGQGDDDSHRNPDENQCDIAMAQERGQSDDRGEDEDRGRSRRHSGNRATNRATDAPVDEGPFEGQVDTVDPRAR